MSYRRLIVKKMAPPYDTGVEFADASGRDSIIRIASVFGNRDRAEQYAELFAAAPELVEALQNIAGALNSGGLRATGNPGTIQDTTQAIRGVHAVLTKLQGAKPDNNLRAEKNADQVADYRDDVQDMLRAQGKIS